VSVPDFRVAIVLAIVAVAISSWACSGTEEGAADSYAQALPAPEGRYIELRAEPGLRFDNDSVEAPDSEFTLRFVNVALGTFHNISVYTQKGIVVATVEDCRGYCYRDVSVNLVSGSYTFQCDIHPVMRGVLEVGNE
jgi:plastocyanin